MLKRSVLALILFASSTSTNASDLNSDLVALANIYRTFMFSNSPSETTLEQLDNIESQELNTTKTFIKECIKLDNRLTSEEFLKLPDETTLKFIYTVRKINFNLREEEPEDNNVLISELNERSISRYELVDSYYSILFTAIGNKNKPFDLSEVNFKLFKYELKDETEKGIFFLQAMNFCGSTIWGYMNIVKPPNYKKALKYIQKFPKFNGQPYYQYLNFGFEDFEMVIVKDKGAVSYKEYYINKYYNTLLYHLSCLSQKKRHKEDRLNLILGSILKEESYYQYSDKQETLESLFSKVE